MTGGRDDAQRMTEALSAAVAQRRSVSICGSGSKRQRFGQLDGGPAAADSERLSTVDHSGIVYYAPDELVLEARSGTPLALIEQELAQHEQMLAFEPPRYRGGGTIGGAVASGLSGPARPWRGALRDAVLGVELLNGLGERLRFGGRVVKNVAGYDVSRLQVGAFGTLGVLLNVSVRVMPRPLSELTVQLSLPLAQAFAEMSTWTQRALPLAGSCYYQGQLYLRLLGAPDAVSTAAAQLGGEHAVHADLWQLLRDQVHPFFAEEAPAARASLPVAAAALPEDEHALIEWGGAQRWYRQEQVPDPEQIRALGGYLLGYQDPGLTRVDSATAALNRRLREAFDPHGLLNPHLCCHAH